MSRKWSQLTRVTKTGCSMRLGFQSELRWNFDKVEIILWNSLCLLHSWEVSQCKSGSLAHFIICGVLLLSTGSFPCQTLPGYHLGALRNMKFMMWDFSSYIMQSSPFHEKKVLQSNFRAQILRCETTLMLNSPQGQVSVPQSKIPLLDTILLIAS